MSSPNWKSLRNKITETGSKIKLKIKKDAYDKLNKIRYPEIYKSKQVAKKLERIQVARKGLTPNNIKMKKEVEYLEQRFIAFMKKEINKLINQSKPQKTRNKKYRFYYQTPALVNLEDIKKAIEYFKTHNKYKQEIQTLYWTDKVEEMNQVIKRLKQLPLEKDKQINNNIETFNERLKSEMKGETQWLKRRFQLNPGSLNEMEEIRNKIKLNLNELKSKNTPLQENNVNIRYKESLLKRLTEIYDKILKELLKRAIEENKMKIENLGKLKAILNKRSNFSKERREINNKYSKMVYKKNLDEKEGNPYMKALTSLGLKADEMRKGIVNKFNRKKYVKSKFEEHYNRDIKYGVLKGLNETNSRVNNRKGYFEHPSRIPGNIMNYKTKVLKKTNNDLAKNKYVKEEVYRGIEKQSEKQKL